MNYKCRPPFLANSFGRQLNDFPSQSPAKEPSASNSLSLSFSNQKNQPDGRQFRYSTNKENNPHSLRQEDIDLFSLQKKQVDVSNSQLNEQLAMLQGKLTNLEEKFLNLTTPPKARKGTVKNKKAKEPHQSLIIKQHETKRPQNDNTVKRRSGVSGKIQSTTRFSIAERKPSDQKMHKFLRPLSRQSQYTASQNCSLKSIRSIERSKNKQIKNLKVQMSKCKNQRDLSLRSKQKIQKELTNLKQAIKQYKVLQKRQKEMLQENLRLAKQLKRSETIRERQKKIIEQMKKELKHKESQPNTKRI